MIVEPFAGHKIEDNLHALGRAFYGASTLLGTPASLSQEVGLALGAQAGAQRLRDVVSAGGLKRFRRATQTPFHMIFEVRPRNGLTSGVGDGDERRALVSISHSNSPRPPW